MPKTLHLGILLILAPPILLSSGCMTRSLNPPLPYVQPANSAPEQDQGRLRLAARVEEFEAELQKLRGAVERLQNAGADEKTIAALQRRVALIEKRLGIESPSAESSTQSGQGRPPFETRSDAIRQFPPQIQAQAQPQSFPRGAPPPSIAQAPQPEMTPDAPADDEKAFRDAYMAFRKGDLKDALPLFEAFVRNHPKSVLAPDAVYWLGETCFGLERYDEAVLSFDRVVKDFPGSKKELAALLRQGESFEKMGDAKSARIIYEKLMKEHPHAAQARTAKSRLAGLPKE
jgi:tol-pal system protein YbgF